MIGVSVAVGLGLVVRAMRWRRRDAVVIAREMMTKTFVEIVGGAVIVLLLAIAVVLICTMPDPADVQP